MVICQDLLGRCAARGLDRPLTSGGRATIGRATSLPGRRDCRPHGAGWADRLVRDLDRRLDGLTRRVEEQVIRPVALLCALAAGVLGAAPGPPPQLATTNVRDFVGREFTVCGRVVFLGCSKSGDTVLLGLDGPGEAGSVSIGVRTAQRQVFGEWFEEPYLGAEVCATGRVERIERKHVVVVDALASLALQKPGPPDFSSVIFESSQSCGTGIQNPKLVREVRPVYTGSAMRAKIQGSVTLEAVVRPDGSVGDVRVVRSLDAKEGLDEAAIAAAQQWRFLPAQRRGQAVPVSVTIELSFRLK